MGVFAAFERLVDPYPETPVVTPPAGFWPFMRASTQGLGKWIAAMTGFTAAIGVFEALLYAWLGSLVDWLAKVPPDRLWADEGAKLLALGAVLVGSIALVAMQSMLKQQALSGNFPMRLRWNFHRLMLGQSMGFYGDEFAGRVAAKVMQTALAVRDVWMILCDILVFIVIYFVTLVAVVGSFNAWMLVPLLGWLLLYGLTLHEAGIEDADHNMTRFVVLAREPMPPPAGVASMTTFIFEVKNIPAALYKALGGFATNGVNMTKLESYQVGGSFAATKFYADIVGAPGDERVDRALEELDFQTKSLSLLGTYPQARPRP